MRQSVQSRVESTRLKSNVAGCGALLTLER
ncbi:Protein of unknown function [Propionibacterium freudenreichii]|nr:Protein of unknown function [Propionibacterium freudenreichii]